MISPRQLLAEEIGELERLTRAESYQQPLIRATGEAGTVLGFPDIAARAAALLANMPARGFWAGTITNIEPDAAMIERFRRMRPADALERKIPVFDKAGAERAAAMQEITRLAWGRRYDEALARAEPRSAHETAASAEIAVTAAVVGDFEIAERILAADPHCKRDRAFVSLVLAIEYARAGMQTDADRHVEALQPVAHWDSVHLALGLAGRRPWEIYPYPDY